MYHWDLPQALQDQGGWNNRDTALRFADYAAYLFAQLGQDIPLWMTHNEPFVAAFFGHGNGTHAPGIRNPWRILPAAHHMLVSHGLAVQAFRATVPNAPSASPPPAIGIALMIWPHHAASNHPRDIAAAHRTGGAMNRMFLESLFHGRYPEDMWRHFQWRFMLPRIEPDDLAIISQPIDFLGVNTYTRLVNAANRFDLLMGARQVRQPGPYTSMGWEVYPLCIYEALTIARMYTDIPLYITENGLSREESDHGTDSIDDEERIDYLRDHVAQAHRAIRAGIDLRGYFIWTLMDNFEWNHGYRQRFGLLHVDFATLKRTWKRSAFWYRDVIAQNGF